MAFSLFSWLIELDLTPLLLRRRLNELVNENLRRILGTNRIVWAPGQRVWVFPKLTPVNHWLRTPQGASGSPFQ